MENQSKVFGQVAKAKPLTDAIQILLHRLINTFTIQFPASRHS